MILPLGGLVLAAPRTVTTSAATTPKDFFNVILKQETRDILTAEKVNSGLQARRICTDSLTTTDDRWLGMLLIYMNGQERGITGSQRGSQWNKVSSSMAEKLRGLVCTTLLGLHIYGSFTRAVNLVRVPLFGGEGPPLRHKAPSPWVYVHVGKAWSQL